MAIDKKETQGLLKKFWSSEIIAEDLYRFLAARYDDADLQRRFLEIGRMERGHATVWNRLAERVHAVSFHTSIFLRLRILLAKVLSVLLPLTIFIHYLEHTEKKAILDYAGLLERYKDDERASTIIVNVIKQEIGHEWHMIEQIADRRLYIEKVREAIPGMTAGIIETLGLVMGLLAAHVKMLAIGLTGLIVMISGLIAEMSVSYIGSKGHHDLHEGRNKELNVKTEINPAVLRRELESDLMEKGIGTETIGLIMDILGDDTVVLSSLVRTIRIGADVPHPAESLRITGEFFLLGALPVLAPFLVGAAWGSPPLAPAIVAFVLAVFTISIAGLFTAVLSGRSIWTNIVHNLLIVIGTCVITFTIGLAARIVLGIGH